MIAPARVAAYHIGLSVSSGRSTLSDSVAGARRTLDDDRDQALAAEIAIGVQRWRAALDHLVAQVSKRPPDRLDPEILEILRIGVYQLLRLTRVPAAAVVDDAVKLAGRAGKRSASGLVNAVLRSISRNRHRISLPSTANEALRDTGPQRHAVAGPPAARALQPLLPDRPSSPDNREAALDYLAVTLSHPRWLVDRWYGRYGFDAAERWAMFDNTPAPVTLRVNRLRHSVEDVLRRLESAHTRARRSAFCPDALLLEHGSALNVQDVDDGWYLVQDEASQLVAMLVGGEPGRRVLDTCAAPGVKTIAISARMPQDGLLVACDIRPRRMEVLARTVGIAGAQNVRLVQADAMSPLPFTREFDTEYIDAPCSGKCTIRRDPDIKWRRQETDLPALAAAELVMLHNAARLVRRGGRLIYATCSSEPDENESVVNAFLGASPDFVKIDPRAAAPDIDAAVIDTDGHLRTFPHMHGLEAFFGAVFQRSSQ